MKVYESEGARTFGDFPDLSPQAMGEALANLRLHQIELEMQNDELRRTQAALDTANSRYFDFYDLAPVGYLTVSQQAVILQANLSTAQLLGVPRATLIGKLLPSYIFSSDADAYYLLCKQVFASQGVQATTELRMQQADGSLLWVSVQAIAVAGDAGAPVLRLVLSDITRRRQLEQLAKEASEDKFRLVADNTLDGILIVGADDRIEYVSPAYVQQLGYHDVDEFNALVASVFALVHPRDQYALRTEMDRATASNARDQLFSYRIQHRLGHYLWRESSAKYQYDEAGRLLRTCFVVRDITQRRQVEEVLRIAAAAFETMDAILITDTRSVIRMVNPAFTKSTGYTADEAVGQTPRFLRSGRHNDDYFHQLWDTVCGTGRWQGEIWDRHKDGAIVLKWLSITAVKGVDGDVSHYVCSYFDLSERKRAEAAWLDMNHNLAQSRQQLRQLVASNEARLEQEKRHIAREVHDELGQVLTALRMDLSLAIIRHSSSVPALEAELTGMKKLVDRAILGVRAVATSLRPVALDMGLVPSIAWLCQEFARHGDVACTLEAPDASVEMEANRNVVIFRIVQESLTNIRKYAQASLVTVSLLRRGVDLLLEIRDNGLGFDPAAVARRGSLGLVGIRERVISLGGQIDINSAPEQGTTIAVVIPLEQVLAKELK
ncbi:PAS domain S-box protein [Rhodoferax sp. BLA1]|uniref:sensor histidine kinase n=1 Tax=Rhodoferax sp. BLA1 TaxID=2576062 RepID=UPI0015D229CF|nr:PAS domain S-box protein [Rhodoferax sp. BLA1]